MNFSDVVPQDDYELGLLRDAQQRIGALPFWDSGSDIRSQTMADIYRYRETKTVRDPDPDPKPVPVPLPTGSNVRIDEDEGRKCRLLIICFMPTKSTVERDEFKRQMELQQDGLNAMTPQEMLANRAAYEADPTGMRALSEPLQAKTREEFRTTPRIQQKYIAKYGPTRWRAELDKYLSSAAALHNPDMVAGGRYDSVVNQTLPIEDRIGGLPENSSMGSQWINPNRNSNTRASRLVEHAKRQAQNNCTSVQVDLRMCPSDSNYPGKPITGI